MYDLPEQLFITPEPTAELIEQIEQVCQQGAKLIQLRSKKLDQAAFFILAQPIIQLAHTYQAQIFLNGPLLSAQQLTTLQADGVHLTVKQCVGLTVKPDLPVAYLSTACHDLAQLLHAQQLGFDCVTLSPVLPTKTHPEAKPLGWTLFAQFAQRVSLPIYALGGLKPEDLSMAKAHDAYGVAGIRAFFGH